MFEEIFPHKAANPASRIADADRGLPQLTEQALHRLLNASHYAEDTGRNVWEFAVTISELRRDGVTENELRWLVCRGYVEHATEMITTPGNDRTFDRHVNLRFCKETVFVITSAGVTFSHEFLKVVAHQDVDADADGERKPLDGKSQPAGTRLPKESTPISNGNAGPKWDRDRHELRVGGQLVKVFKLPSPMQETILVAFEEEHWPPRIDDPLPVHPDLLPKRRLHDTIKSLNRNQKSCLIRFMGDGTGEGIRWELSLAGDSAEHSNLPPQ